MKTTRMGYLALSVFSLVLGISIYLFFRDNTLLIYKWIPQLLVFPKLFSLELKTIPNIHPFITYSLPDGLWILSVIFFMRSLWLKNQKIMKIYICVFCSFAIIFELLQLNKNIPGTFDFFDLLIFLFIPLLEGIIYTNFFKE
jgi:hypothetical protein